MLSASSSFFPAQARSINRNTRPTPGVTLIQTHFYPPEALYYGNPGRAEFSLRDAGVTKRIVAGHKLSLRSGPPVPVRLSQGRRMA
jgi:hypothetical protein